MAAPAPRPVHTAGRRCERETSGMAISNCRSRSGTKNTGCGSNHGTTLFEEQNGRSTRARDHAFWRGTGSSNPFRSSGESDELPPEQVRSRRISRLSAIGISRRLRGAPAFLHPWPERVRGSPRLRRDKPVHSRRTAWSVQRTAWPAAAAEPAAAGSARQRIRLDVGARLLAINGY